MKKILIMLMMLTFLLITGCTTTPTEETPQRTSVLSESNTIDSTSVSEGKNQSSDMKSDFSETTQPSINSEEVSMQLGDSNSSTPQQTSDSVTASSNTKDGADTGVPPPESSFKSVAEMLDWIQNDDYADCVFKQSVKQLKLDKLLIIESADKNFKLDEIRVFHTYPGIMYEYVNEKEEIIELYIDLSNVNSKTNYLETFIADINLTSKKIYKNYSEFQEGKEVVILGKSRKMYTKDAYQDILRETGESKSFKSQFYMDVDGFLVRGTLRESWRTGEKWDNKYLNYFKFSMRGIKM